MYETETNYTYSELKKLHGKLLSRDVYKSIIFYVIALIAILGTTNIYCYIAYLGMVIMYFLVLFFKRNKRIKKSWYLDNTTEMLNNRYIFFDDHFEEKNEVKNSFIYYKDIYRIVEKKEEIYISTSINKWYIIIKENCSEELLSLIRMYK